AHRDAGRLIAMQTGFGEIDGARALAFALLKGVDAVEPHAPGASAIGAKVGQGSRMPAGVPLLAGGGAGVAADADVEIDDEPELFGTRPWLRQRGHAFSFAVATHLDIPTLAGGGQEGSRGEP